MDSTSDAEGEAVPDPHERVRLRFAHTRSGEVALLVGAVLFAALMAFGTTLWGSSNWLHQVCPWLAVLSALLFAVLLACNLFRPQVVTVRLVRIWVVTLCGIAGLAILCGVLGLFVYPSGSAGVSVALM